MKNIISFLKQRWLVSLIGTIAISLVVWFFGPMFGFGTSQPLAPEINRYATIAVIFLVWLIIRIIAVLKARKKNEVMMAGMVQAPQEPVLSPAEQASQDELHTLGERMEHALSELKNAKLGGASGRQYLYQLPWYIVIGPPGSGKTTLLKNSQLKFPLADQFGDEAIRGVGGTRNCDWWFTEDAVLLDTAGRYTTQDSQKEVDSQAWLGFLNLLKKHRRRRPINGAVIAVSISELLESNAEQRLAHARAIRKRANELHENLGIRFPVYLVFTKCDLLSGFMEFFDDLDHNVRDQVWGTTFPLSEDLKTNPVSGFEQEFELLEQQLQSQLIEKLERERNTEKRSHIYTFPQQFAALKPIATDFVNEIFQPSRFQHQAMIRGIYFTSATQEGTPIDRIMGSMASNFSVERNSLTGTSGAGKSFFINKLLGNVIFAESGLAGSNSKLEKQRALFQRGSALAIGLASLLVMGLWVMSYMNNRSYMNKVNEKAESVEKLANQLPPRETSPLATLPLLDTARSLSSAYSNELHGRSFSNTFGLYQGDKLGKSGDISYRRLLKQALLPRLLQRLEQQISENGSNTDYQFESLKTYLMLDDTDHFDADAIRAWITLDWDNNLPIDTSIQQRTTLLEHLDALLNANPAPLPSPLALNASLVDDARAALSRAPLADRVYGRLKLEVNNTDIPDFRISEAAGREAPLVFARKSNAPLNEGISGFFTQQGYKALFLPKSKQLAKQVADESWILGPHQIQPSGEELTQLNEDVQKLYVDEFVREWQTLLSDVRIAHFSEAPQAAQILNILSSDQSPLRLLLEAVENETNLQEKTEPTPKDKSTGMLSDASKALRSIAGKSGVSSNILNAQAGASKISDKFKRLNELSQSKDGTPPPIERILALLNELYVHLNSIPLTSGDVLVDSQSKQVKQVAQKTLSEAKRQPALVGSMLKSISENIITLVGGGVCQHIKKTWRDEVAQFCGTAINGRYPVNTSGSNEISQDDFGLLFGPGGKLETFFNKYLASSVEKYGPQWRWVSRDGSPACVSDSNLRQFKRADTIKNAFFRIGTPVPSVGFRLKPLSMSAEITQLYLDIDGQKLGYSHGPIQATPMKWPGPNGSEQVNLQISPPAIGGTSGITEDGPWALFKLIDRGSLQRLGRSEQFVLSFDFGGRDVSFELRANSAVNPFGIKDLQQFRCPQNL